MDPAPAPRSLPVSACIALGSNLGDREAHLAAAIAALRREPGIEVVAVSPFYETDPVGPPPQGPYLNAAVRVKTGLAARELLDRLLQIEAAEGRRRSRERYTPRTLDLDLLLYGDDEIFAELSQAIPPAIAGTEALYLIENRVTELAALHGS